MNGIFLSFSLSLTAEAPAKTFPFIIPKEDDENKFQQWDEISCSHYVHGQEDFSFLVNLFSWLSLIHDDSNDDGSNVKIQGVWNYLKYNCGLNPHFW